MYPSVSCEWKRGTGRPKERKKDRKSTQGSNDNKQITQERRSLWTFPVRKSAFFFSCARSLFPLTSFFYPPLAPFSPEISFQHAKPCKNRPRVLKLRPACKDVPACYAVSGCCCSGPHVPEKNVFSLLVCPQFVLIVCIVVAAIIIGEMQRTKFDNEEPRRSQAGVIAWGRLLSAGHNRFLKCWIKRTRSATSCCNCAISKTFLIIKQKKNVATQIMYQNFSH